MKVLFIENGDSFSWNVVDVLPVTRAEVTVRTLPGARALLAEADVVVIGPGPKDPHRAGLVELAAELLRREIPTLGICLGHQAVGMALGARLERARPAHGKRAELTVSGSRFLPAGRYEVMRYHSLALAGVVEPCAVVGALHDGTVMAVEHRSLPVLGLQFHPDSHGTPEGRRLVEAFFRQRSAWRGGAGELGGGHPGGHLTGGAHSEGRALSGARSDDSLGGAQPDGHALASARPEESVTGAQPEGHPDGASEGHALAAARPEGRALSGARSDDPLGRARLEGHALAPARPEESVTGAQPEGHALTAARPEEPALGGVPPDGHPDGASGGHALHGARLDGGPQLGPTGAQPEGHPDGGSQPEEHALTAPRPDEHLIGGAQPGGSALRAARPDEPLGGAQPARHAPGGAPPDAHPDGGSDAEGDALTGVRPAGAPLKRSGRLAISELESHPSFALLGPGFRADGMWTLLAGLAPGGDELAVLEAEARTPSWFSGERRVVDVEMDVAPATAPLIADLSGYVPGIADIQEQIARGDVYQVNLTRRASVDGVTGSALLHALCRRGVPRFAAWVRLPGGDELVSASPELLVEVDGRRIRSEPMKGTAAPADARELEASTKDRAELAMITDLVRNDLQQLCVPGTVAVPCPRRLITLPYVVQAVSDVEGTLRPEVDLAAALAVLHPGGSVTGAPRAAALEVIARLESSPRRFYCGTLGLRTGSLTRCALLIRTAYRTATGWIFGVGGGITSDSEPQAELAEVRLKLEALGVPVRERGA